MEVLAIAQLTSWLLVSLAPAGNHEYDYTTGKEKRRWDPSGAVRPYDPDWGNFGAHRWFFFFFFFFLDLNSWERSTY